MAPSSAPRITPVLRFAPSPNGRLHLGHALSALTNADFAARLGGKLLLRIEDIDLQRCRPEFVRALPEDLAWLGLRFDGAVRRQSRHFDDYRAATARLRGMGLVYPCFCSRLDIRKAIARHGESEGAAGWPVDPDGAPLYPGTCRGLGAAEVAARLQAGAPHVLRLALAAALRQVGPGSFRRFDGALAESLVAARPERWGDVVLVRREVPTSYHLSVVVDDAAQGVTHVVRGTDLEAASDVHVLLQRLLALPVPRYHFHRLIADESGRKLAKSRGSQSLADLRAQGVSAAMVRRRLGFT